MNKSAESKCPIYLLQGFGANTLYLKKGNKSKRAKRNKNRECEGVGPFKEIELKLQIN